MDQKGNRSNTIDKISSLLAYLVELKNQGKYQQAIDIIDDALLEYFNFDSHATIHISEEFLRDTIEKAQEPSPELISRLGEFFAEKGDLLYTQHKFKESKNILSNALTIYFYLNDNQDFFSFERMNKMVMINQKLSQIDLKIED